MAMIEKTFVDANLEIKLTSYIDSKQNIWFKVKEIAQILGYVDTDDAIRRHASEKYKKTYPGVSPGQVRYHQRKLKHFTTASEIKSCQKHLHKHKPQEMVTQYACTGTNLLHDL